jgi:hypothetical protein
VIGEREVSNNGVPKAKEKAMHDGVLNLTAWIENKKAELVYTCDELRAIISTLETLLGPVEKSVAEIEWGLQTLKEGLETLSKRV